MQKRVKDFVEQYSLSCGVRNRYMDLVSEVGELGKEILKSTDYGKTSFQTTDAAKEEMGDCLFSILALCEEMNIDAHDAMNGALRKYAQRFEKAASIGSGQ